MCKKHEQMPEGSQQSCASYKEKTLKEWRKDRDKGKVEKWDIWVQRLSERRLIVFLSVPIPFLRAHADLSHSVSKRKAGGEGRKLNKGRKKSRAVVLLKAVMLSIRCHRETRLVCAGFPFDQTTKPQFNICSCIPLTFYLVCSLHQLRAHRGLLWHATV